MCHKFTPWSWLSNGAISRRHLLQNYSNVIPQPLEYLLLLRSAAVILSAMAFWHRYTATKATLLQDFNLSVVIKLSLYLYRRNVLLLFRWVLKNNFFYSSANPHSMPVKIMTLLFSISTRLFCTMVPTTRCLVNQKWAVLWLPLLHHSRLNVIAIVWFVNCKRLSYEQCKRSSD